MVQELLNILKHDSELTQLLEATPQDAKIYLNSTIQQDNCIVYKYIPLTADGIVQQSRLEVTCISKDYERALEILKCAQAMLITVGDVTQTIHLIDITKNGGGYVFDEAIKVHKFMAFFNIKERMR